MGRYLEDMTVPAIRTKFLGSNNSGFRSDRVLCNSCVPPSVKKLIVNSTPG